MISRFGIVAAGCTLAICLSGCATIGEPERTGFLSDYSQLKQTDDEQWTYSAGRIGEYSKFIIEPVQMLFEPNSENPEFTDEELEELKAYLENELSTELSEDNGYLIVEEPGPSVASIRFAITDLEATIGALNITIWTKVTGAGLGGIAAEREIVDSVTGEQLAAAISWGAGSRILLAGLTKLGDAERVIRRWAKEIREHIDVAHGRQGAD